MISLTRWQRDGKPVLAEDECAAEEPLAIRVDGRTLHITMRTPGHDRELALGFLLAENLVGSRHDVAGLEQTAENRISLWLRAGCSIDFEKLTRHVYGSSSCGLCGKTAIDRVRLPLPPVTRSGKVAAELLLALPDRLRATQTAFDRTGGLHAAAAFTVEGELVVAREDIGRHNAVDKILGYGMEQGLLPFSNHVLLVSSRSSFEILQKSVAGGFPIVASVSAPSSLAVSFARESGQTLVGFLRGDRLNAYCGENRIDFSSSPH